MDPENYSNPKDFDPSRWDVSSIYIYIYIYIEEHACINLYLYIQLAHFACMY
jgi:cytochrome P450